MQLFWVNIAHACAIEYRAGYSREIYWWMHLIWLRWLLFIFHSFSCLGSWLMKKVCDLSSLTFYEHWAHLVGMCLWICEWNRSSHVYDSRAYSNWALCTYWLNDSLSIESCFFQLDLSWTVTFLFASTSHARGHSCCEKSMPIIALRERRVLLLF